MLFIYRILINLIILFSPLIILVRVIKNKEDKFRFKEKFGFFSKKRGNGKLIWFHGSSVGEILSVIPLIEALEKKKKIDKILITSSTLSSSKVLSNFKVKKTIHQFFPIDSNFLTKKFLNYWKPSAAIFIDSEIWPNLIFDIKKKNIPFRSFEIKKRDEKTLGELFCFFILETILIGKALKINPFDQPAVELIKKETKKILL